MLFFPSNAIDLLKKLCELRADVNAKDCDGNTALHYVAVRNDLKMLDVLDGYEPKLYRNKDRKAALDLAQEKNYSAVVNIIKQYQVQGNKYFTFL